MVKYYFRINLNNKTTTQPTFIFMRFLKLIPILCICSLFFVQSAGAQATLGGYGELHFNDVTSTTDGENPEGELDFHRFILFAGYDFNDWISFRSELELEHTLLEAGEEDGGEVALEQAYVNLQIKRSFGIRAGIMLVPVGIVNPVHEPPTFNGVERPNVEKFLIPSTWREAGIGVYGNTQSGLSYQAYVMAGLAPGGITGDEGIRDARQSGFESSTANVAFTGRLDYNLNLNLKLGASYFVSSLSNETEGDEAQIAGADGALFNLVEGHLIYTSGQFEARGLLVYSSVSDAPALNDAFGNSAGEAQLGGYGELAYDILPFFSPLSEQQLLAFGRYESYDTQFRTAGIPDNEEFNRNEYTFGLTYKPAPRVAFKADYQFLQSAGEKDVEQFNLGVGYNF